MTYDDAQAVTNFPAMPCQFEELSAAMLSKPQTEQQTIENDVQRHLDADIDSDILVGFSTLLGQSQLMADLLLARNIVFLVCKSF